MKKKASSEDGPERAAIRQALNDGELYDAKSIHEKIKELLNRDVPILAIHGLLKGSEFEKVEDKFRLKK